MNSYESNSPSVGSPKRTAIYVKNVALTLVACVLAATLVPTLYAQGQGGGSSVTARLDALEAQVASLNGRVASLESLLTHFSRNGNDIYITGANLHIVNGLGATNGLPSDPFSNTNYAVNGLGNLIVGYQEERSSGNVRTGSHNLIIGTRNNYSNFAGLISGHNNELGTSTIAGRYGVVFGQANQVLADFSTITGGQQNTVNGAVSSICGGMLNQANGGRSVVGGGFNVTAGGGFSWAGGSEGSTSYSGNFRSP